MKNMAKMVKDDEIEGDINVLKEENNQTVEKLARAALNKWGSKAQITMTYEELGELIKALAKHERYDNRDSLKDLTEEVADVEIMLHQLKEIFKIHNRVEAFKRSKLHRLADRL